MKNIKIINARTHNLKNINLEIPRDSLIVMTGPSGSGKSSLAFDTLYAEGQRRYVESLSSYARQFLSMMEKPEVDRIEGLSPAISIEQKTTSHNPRSTVGTVTEIYDYLRLFFARVGTAHCPEHGHPLLKQSVEQIADNIMTMKSGAKIVIASPVVRMKKGSHEQIFEKFRKLGYIRVICDDVMYDIDALPKIDPKVLHTIEIVVDRISIKDDILSRLRESIETALKASEGLVSILDLDDERNIITRSLVSSKHACPDCGFSISELEPRMFSFNNPLGSCEVCDGLGFGYRIDPERTIQAQLTISQGALWGFDRQNPFYFDMLCQFCEQHKIPLDVPFEQLTKQQRTWLVSGEGAPKFIFKSSRYGKSEQKMAWAGTISSLEKRYLNSDNPVIKEQFASVVNYLSCESCGGDRLKEPSRFVRINDMNLPSLCRLSIDEAFLAVSQFELEGVARKISQPITNEISSRLQFLIDVGLGYLTLARSADSLSGGESQRIRLASQIGSKLVGVMYILDEPSIGLHQRDNQRLISTLRSLVDLGNTVIVVEHDEEAMLASDYLVDLGPGAGCYGGEIVAQGTPAEVMKHPTSSTAQYLNGKKKIKAPYNLKKPDDRFLTVIGAHENNLKKVNVSIPVGLFTVITGVSGSGKSSLINRTIFPYLAYKLNKAHLSHKIKVDRIEGLEHFEKVISIDQSPIGRTPRSNPATYTGVLTPIRELFALTTSAKSLGFTPGRFSFNIDGGRCIHCEGDGVIKVEMHFLADIYVTCEACQGRRYNEQTLSIQFKGKNISEVLEMTVDEAADFFKNFPKIFKKCETLQQVGLGYIKLGQNATTLSGGEAQRIKLSKELSRRDNGQTIYILDEPTTGLHFDDIQKLVNIIFELRDKGNTLVVIEHNLDMIHCADWVIDLGPDGGSRGGEVLYEGSLSGLCLNKKSHTAKFLKLEKLNS